MDPCVTGTVAMALLGLPSENPDRALKRLGGREAIMVEWKRSVEYRDWAMAYYVIPG